MSSYGASCENMRQNHVANDREKRRNASRAKTHPRTELTVHLLQLAPSQSLTDNNSSRLMNDTNGDISYER